jgi:co-chaperonin GroES (HSP10)
MRYLHDTLVVQLQPRTSIGVLIVPETAKQHHIHQATVLAVGKDFIHKKDIKQGDTVLVSDYFGTAITHDGIAARIYDGEDVIAKVL